MKSMVIGILVVVKYSLGAEINDVQVTDGFPFATDDQKREATERAARTLFGMLAEREGYGDGTGELLKKMLEFDEVTIHDEINCALYRLKIHSVSAAWQ